MASRKIQKSRSGSYLISLPKSWVEESGLNKGDRVEMRKNEEGLLTLQLTEKKRKMKFNLKLEDFSDIRTLEDSIKACYMQGAETIEVTSEKETMTEEKELLRPLVLELIGSEIYKDRPRLLSFRVLVDPTKFSIPNLIQRIYNLIESVHEDAITALENKNPALASGSGKRGDDAKRLYRLMIRELKISAIDSGVAESIGVEGKGEDLVYTIAARDLSRMAHHTVRFAEIISDSGDRLSEEDIDEIMNISEIVKEMGEKAVKALLNKDIPLAREVIDFMEKIKELDEDYVKNPNLEQIDSQACEIHTKGCLDPEMCDLRTSLSRNLRRIAGYSVALADNAIVGAVPKFRE